VNEPYGLLALLRAATSTATAAAYWSARLAVGDRLMVTVKSPPASHHLPCRAAGPAGVLLAIPGLLRHQPVQQWRRTDAPDKPLKRPDRA
jgi:hypothetical protein